MQLLPNNNLKFLPYNEIQNKAVANWDLEIDRD